MDFQNEEQERIYEGGVKKSFRNEPYLLLNVVSKVSTLRPAMLPFVDPLGMIGLL